MKINKALESAITAHQEGKFQEAEEFYNTILKKAPNHPDANHNLGVLFFSLDKNDKALKLFKIALDADPEKQQFWFSYIQALIKGKEFDIARKYLNEGKNKGLIGNNLESFENLLIKVNLEEDSKFLALEGKEIPKGKSSESSKIKQDINFKKLPIKKRNVLLKYFETGQFKDAEKLAKSLIRDYPHDSFSFRILGMVLKETDRVSESLIIIKKLIDIDPKDYWAMYFSGLLLIELNKLEEAEAITISALKIKSDFAEGYFSLGNIYRLQGRLEEAERKYIKALAIKPDYAEANNNLGLTLKKLGRLDESLDKYKTAIGIRPDYIGARMNIEKITQKIVPAWHLSMMNDEPRNNAYLEAIKLAVDKDTFVLEIGTGSGLLSMMAAANGAEEVITCETTKAIADVAKKIIHKNGYEKNINVINKKSTELILGEDLPRKADLLISEILSSEFVGEGVRKSILDANKRLLKDNGKMIPESGSIRIALLGCNEEILNAVYVDSSNGFDLSEFNSISQHKFTLNLKEKPKFLSKALNAFDLDLYNISKNTKEEKIIQLQADNDGLCIGLIQWLKVKLYKEIEYENIPYGISSHWSTPIYTFDKPVELKKGDFIEIKALLDEDSVWFDSA